MRGLGNVNNTRTRGGICGLFSAEILSIKFSLYENTLFTSFGTLLSALWEQYNKNLYSNLYIFFHKTSMTLRGR